MAKFFRTFRQNSMAESRIGRYLLYAVGEIILLVIGILIAVQINLRNEAAKNERAESIYIQNILKDIDAQQKSIEVQVDYESSYISSAKYLIETLENKEIQVDQKFAAELANLLSRRTFVVQDATYTDLISSGKINLINDEGVRNDLISYYQEMERMEKVIYHNNSDIIDGNISHVLEEFGYINYSFEKLNHQGYLKNSNSAYHLGHFDEQFADISTQIMTDPRVRLHVMNAVKKRLLIATIHHEMMDGATTLSNELKNRIKE
ncbi:MAG: hypothetical protein H6546_00700 [Chitinophagales bacterium]|nr:hypothetical protein [Chitinophagales bacterium]